MPTKPKPVTVADAETLESASEEIERQSARIQREMERERRSRSVSPVRGVRSTTSPPIPPRSARGSSSSHQLNSSMLKPASDTKPEPLTVASLGAHMEQADKMILGQELKTLRGALLTTRLQLQEAEKEARIVRGRAEEARSELMLIDFKRTTANKDLQRLADDLERKRAMAQDYEHEMVSKRRGMDALGLSANQAKHLQDEIATLKQRQRGMTALEMERDELARQLEGAKDDLLREQRQGRLQREELAEEMETLTSRLEEAQNSWREAQEQLDKTENAYRRMERDKNELIQEQSKEYNALRTQSQQENKESRSFLSKEMDVLNGELQQQHVRVAELQSNIKLRDDNNLKLQEEILTLTSQVTQEQQARAAVTEEHRKTLQMLRRETDSAMLQLRESLFLDKQRALEDLRTEIEQERRDSSYRADERLAQMLAENADLISEKNQEILVLQDKLRELQQVQHSVEKRMQESLDMQVREAVARERVAMDKETQWQLRNERENLARDSKQRANEMQMTVERERETTQRLVRELELLKGELEEQRRVSREAVKEKSLAVAKVKEEAKVQSKTELDNVREQLKQDMQREVDRLQGQLKKVEEENRSLKTETQRLEGRQRDSVNSLDRTERTVINEINEECRRSATLLGVTPRQVPLSTMNESTTTRSQITAALANLRAVNEELRKHVQEVTSELGSCRALAASLEKDKVDSVERVRMELETQKAIELEKIKEQLIRDHAEELAQVAQASARQSLANSMVGALRHKDQEIDDLKRALASWREQAAEKYTRFYKNELVEELEKSQTILRQSGEEQKRINDSQQREINRLEKEVQKLARMQKTNDVSTPSPHQQQQMFLQARIKQLNSENNALRRKHLLSKNNVSVPDLSTSSMSLNVSPRRALSPTPGDKLRKLEERMRRGEKEALMAEERARLKQSAITQKMAEMTKLQDTLSDQNHELMRLEHAYTQLHRQYNDSPALPASHILNNTR